jgi:DUF4097 and DUF4098 domain-containing protein YvlB
VPAFAQTTFRYERPAPRIRADWAQRFEQSRLGPEQTARFAKTIKAGRGSTLDLENISGSITVTGANGDDIVIEAIKRTRARDEARAKELLDQIDIRVTERPSRVTVRTVYPRLGNQISVAVDYTVRVPLDASVDLSSVSGDLRVTNVKGELRLETVNGSVKAGQAPRLGYAKTVSGNVEITGLIEGELSASSLTGALLLTGVRARALELTTISGDVVMNDVLVDRAMRVRSVNGDVQFAGPLTRNGRYEMNSHAGRIRIVVPQVPGFELDASTFSGNLRSDIPLTIISSRDPRTGEIPRPPTPPIPPTPPDRPGERARIVIRERGARGGSQTIRGTFGDASAYIVVHTFSGDIVIQNSEKKP